MVVREKDALQQLLGAFADVFKEELGTITPGKTKLVVPASTTPQVTPSTTIPLCVASVGGTRVGSSRASRSIGAC